MRGNSLCTIVVWSGNPCSKASIMPQPWNQYNHPVSKMSNTSWFNVTDSKRNRGTYDNFLKIFKIKNFQKQNQRKWQN